MFSSATGELLTVMYATDISNGKTPVKSAEIKAGDAVGTVMFGKAILFSRNKAKLDSAFAFTSQGSGERSEPKLYKSWLFLRHERYVY